MVLMVVVMEDADDADIRSEAAQEEVAVVVELAGTLDCGTPA
jgi:hypothetical protein